MLYWNALGCNLAVLGCTGLYWTVVDGTGMYLALLGCTGLHWAVMGCARL